MWATMDSKELCTVIRKATRGFKNPNVRWKKVLSLGPDLREGLDIPWMVGCLQGLDKKVHENELRSALLPS